MERAVPVIGPALLCSAGLLPFLALFFIHLQLCCIFFLGFPLLKALRLDFFEFVIVLIWHFCTPPCNRDSLSFWMNIMHFIMLFSHFNPLHIFNHLFNMMSIQKGGSKIIHRLIFYF